MSEPGIPEGWIAEEHPELRFGLWRFYAIEDPEGRSSAPEDNWATRDGVAMDGLRGLQAYMDDVRPLEDPDRVSSQLMAAHVGHFIIRGASRETSVVRVVTDSEGSAAPPSAAIEDGRFVLRAWYQRSGYRAPAEVIIEPNGRVHVQWGQIVVIALDLTARGRYPMPRVGRNVPAGEVRSASTTATERSTYAISENLAGYGGRHQAQPAGRASSSSSAATSSASAAST